MDRRYETRHSLARKAEKESSILTREVHDCHAIGIEGKNKVMKRLKLVLNYCWAEILNG